MERTLLGRLACRLGSHERSRKRAREIPDGWYSRCKRCGILMVKEGDKGKWRAVGRSRATLFERGVIDASGLLISSVPKLPPDAGSGRFAFVRRWLAKLPLRRKWKPVAKAPAPILPRGAPPPPPRRRRLRVGEDGLVRRKPRDGADGGT